MESENKYIETDLGNVAPNPRGEYDPAEAYEYLDLVEYGGGSYLCIQESGTVTGVAPTQNKNTDTWQVLTIPGDLTPEYIAMHDDVVNKAESAQADAASTAADREQVESMLANVEQLHTQTDMAAQEASDSRDSAAGYAAAAEASRTAAAESEKNAQLQVTGFDETVNAAKQEATEEIATARKTAVQAVAAQQVKSVNAVNAAGSAAIEKTSADAKEAKDAKEAAVSAANAAEDSAREATAAAEQAENDKQSAETAAAAAKTSAAAAETAQKAVEGAAGQIETNKTDIKALKEDLDNKIEHVGGYKEYDIGTPSVGTYWNKSAKKQLESETYQSFNPISLKAGTYHYENMSGSFTFYEDTDGNWIPIGKYSTSGNGDVVITNDTTMYITEMQKSGVFVGAKLYSGDITQKESNWFKNPKYDIDNINNTLESLNDSVNDIDGSVIKEYCIYVSTTGSDTSGDGSEEKPFATIYHANETITDNSYAKRYRIIVLPGTYTDLQDKYTGIAQTSKYQGVITKPWVTYESKSGNPEDTIIEWNGSTGLENPIRSDIVEKCAFHIVSLPRTFTAIKGFTIKSKNTRYAMHCESSGMGIQGEWLIENCIFDWGGCPNISDDTGRFPAIGIGMSPCEKGTIKFCKIVTTTVETMLVHDGKNKDGNSAVILGAELNFIKCDLGTGRLQFQSIYPKSGEINAKTNNVCNLISCTQINNLYSYISSLNSDDEMVWRVYGKDCDFASYGNISDYVYKI